MAELTPSGELIAIHDIPTLPDGPAGRRRVNPALLAICSPRRTPATLIVELVNSRPTEGACLSLLVRHDARPARGLPRRSGDPRDDDRPVELEALHWPASSGQRARKGSSRAEAIRRFPAHAQLFARVRDNGRSDACLIGVAGLMRRSK